MADRYNGDDYRSPRTTGGGYERAGVNKTIYVGNLRYDTDEKTVHEWFEKYYGPVSHVKLICDKETGRSKGFAFVTFDDEADATEALNDSNGRDLDGGIIRVNHARGPPSFAGGRRSFDGASRGRGGYYSGRGRYGDSYHQGGRGGGYRGSYHSGERDRSGERGERGRDDERGHSEERERGRYSPRRSRSRSPAPRGGKHEREYRDEGEYYAEEGGTGGKGGEGGAPKRRRRASPSRSPSPSKSRSTGAPSPSHSSGATSDSSGSHRRRHHHDKAPAVEKRAAPGAAGSSKPPPSGEAVKMELMRLRKAEAELGGRVRALESEVKAGKSARLALEAQLEESQAALRSKDDSLRKYRQWLGALLECSTKLAAGRAAVAAAEAEVRQREGDLAVLNEEVAAFMSRAREEQLSSRRARRAAAAAAAGGERSAGAEGDGQGGSLDRDSQYYEGEEGEAGLLGGSGGTLAAGPGGEGAAYGGGSGGAGVGNGELRAVGGAGGGAGVGERASEEAQLAEAMQYAMEEEMPPAGDGPDGGARDDAPAKFAPGVKFKLAM